jgi:hypothetical protein
MMYASQFHETLPRGFSKAKLKRTRERFGLRRALDVHHVVPRQFKNHLVLKREAYDVEEAYNLILLPKHANTGLFTQRLIHNQRHGLYNACVGRELDACTTSAAFLTLLTLLHCVCRGRAGTHSNS